MAFLVMYYSSLQSNSSLLNLVLSSMKWLRHCHILQDPKQDLQIKGALCIRLQLHGAIYRPDSFVLMSRHCANLKAIRYGSMSFNRIVADKSHSVIVALGY